MSTRGVTLGAIVAGLWAALLITAVGCVWARHEARTLFRPGTWQDVSQGTVLTVQRQSVTQLSYLHTGCVDVDIGGKSIAQVGTRRVHR